MRRANIFQQKQLAGVLEELEDQTFRFTYLREYKGEPISFTMPLAQQVYEFKNFPPVLEGLLPEGNMLEAFLKQNKIDRNDLFAQIIAAGRDLVGSLSVEIEK